MCLRTCFVQKSTKIPKTHSKFKKIKKYFLFLNQFQILKFLTLRFLRCNIYQISNNNINYLPKAKLPKQNHSSWLFVQKFFFFKKNQKKVKTQKHKNNSRIAIRLLSHDQNCLLHSLKFLFHILTMMYNIFDINATEVKTNIQCK